MTTQANGQAVESNKEKEEALRQVSVYLPEELVTWISDQVRKREEAGVRVSTSEIIREAILVGAKKIKADTEMIQSLPVKFRSLISNKKKRGLDL